MRIDFQKMHVQLRVFPENIDDDDVKQPIINVRKNTCLVTLNVARNTPIYLELINRYKPIQSYL